MANIISFIILCVFLYGRSLRFKNLKWHIRLMMMAFAADLGLVVGLVIYRRALSKVHLGMPLILKIHVPIAVATVLLYFATTWAGYQLYRGHEDARARLRLLDKIIVPARILTFLTSVLVQILVNQ